MKKIESQLSQLTTAIERLIANPVAPIAPVAPVAPVLPIVPQYSGDHDLLTKLDTKVDVLQTTVNKMADREDMHVTATEFAEHIRAADKVHAEISTLIEKLDGKVDTMKTAQTKIMVWGSVVAFFVALIPSVLRLMGH